MQEDPRQPQPNPCGSCGHKFNFFGDESKGEFAIAMVGPQMAIYCTHCKTVTVQELKGGFFKKPKFVLLESLSLTNFESSYSNTELGLELLNEVRCL